jgi:hypothetical protein
MKTILTFLLILFSLNVNAMPSSFFMAELNFNFSKQLCKTSGDSCQFDPSWMQFGKVVSYYKGECIDFKEARSPFIMAVFPPGTKVFADGYKPAGFYINFATSEERLVKNIKNNYNFESIHPDFGNYMNTEPYYTNDARFYFYNNGYGSGIIRGSKSTLALKFIRGEDASQFCFVESFALDLN